ncbi:MAG TPA: hypothetical protein VIU61_17790 [Kofleriaceae bacterium]
MKLVVAMLAFVVVLGVGLALAPASSGGTITGRVEVVKDGKKTGPRDDVWVYLVEDVANPRERRRRPKSPRKKPPDREIRQVKTQFSPRVLVVPLGTTVTFPNYDLEEHNVFSPTDPPGPFNLGRYKLDKKGKAHTFEDPAEMKIFCDIHKEMSARVKVVDSVFIVPVKNGQFTIEGVPPGRYKVHAWVRDSDEVLEKIEVTEGAVTKTPDMNLQLKPELPHDKWDGSKYGVYRP